MKRVFLDAACWVAASGSTSGGSSAIIMLAQAWLLVLVTSGAVFQEAEKNIRGKMGPAALARFHFLPAALARFHFLLDATAIEICDQTTADEEEKWANLTAGKDRHVLASAIKSKADVLVTLDRQHILTDRVRANFPIPVQDTKEFLTAFRLEL